MNGYQKTATAILTVGLATSVAACSSSGSSSSKKAVGAFKTLTGKSTSVKLDPGFVSALTSLKVKAAPIGTATVSTAGVASFPITGGNATIYKKGAVTPYVQGVIDHQGSGLSLSAGGTEVALKDFVVNPGNNSNLTGEVDIIAGGKTTVFAKSTKLFDLDGSTLQTPTISKAGVATLTGTTVKLSDGAAAALDKVFKVTAIKGGLKIGIATIEATGTS